MQSRNFHYFIFQEKAKGGMDDSAFESLEKDFKEVTIVNTDTLIWLIKWTKDVM